MDYLEFKQLIQILQQIAASLQSIDVTLDNIEKIQSRKASMRPR